MAYIGFLEVLPAVVQAFQSSARQFRAVMSLHTCGETLYAGQQLLLTQEYYLPPQLYYWERLSRGSFAEVDYLINIGQEIIPIEVKAGRGTTLRSLHSFLDEHLSGKACHTIQQQNA